MAEYPLSPPDVPPRRQKQHYQNYYHPCVKSLDDVCIFRCTCFYTVFDACVAAADVAQSIHTEEANETNLKEVTECREVDADTKHCIEWCQSFQFSHS